MNKYIDRNQPVFLQTHENNEFQSYGTSIPCVQLIREKFGYPPKNAVFSYLSATKEGKAVYIEQEYAPPSGGRPADKLSVYSIIYKSCTCKCDLGLFRELASDLLFYTRSALMPQSIDVLVATWISFCEAAKHNPEWHLSNFIIKISDNEPSDKIIPECAALTYESFKNTAFIAGNMPNSKNNRIKAIQLATLDFSVPDSIPFANDEVKKALGYLTECKYKTNGYIYLLQNGDFSSLKFLDINSGISNMLISLYIQSFNEREYKITKQLRAYITEDLFDDYSVVRKLENFISTLEEPEMLEEPLEIIYLCSTAQNIDVCKNYFINFLRQMNQNHMFRHKIMYDNCNEEYLNLFSDIKIYSKNFQKEAAILKGKYQDPYINDAYYLGLVSDKAFKKSCEDINDSIEYLSNLVKEDFNADRNEQISDFFDRTTSSIRRKVKKCVRKSLMHDINSRIKTAWKVLIKAIKAKAELNDKLDELM